MKAEAIVWQRLQAAGLVGNPQPGEPDHGQADTQAPWFMNVLLGLCGWLAAMFLLGFIATAFSDLSDQAGLCLIAGTLSVGLAFIVLRRVSQVFVDNLAFALSLAGQCLVAWGCVQIAAPQALWLWWGGALAQLVLALLMPHPVHRMLSAFAAGWLSAMWLDALGLTVFYPPIVLLAVALLWLNELTLFADVSRTTMLAWGLSLAMLLMLFVRRYENTPYSVFNEAAAMSQWPAWLGEALCAVVMLFVLLVLLKRSGLHLAERSGFMSLLIALLVAIITVPAVGLSSALTLVMLGFALANRALLGLGVLAGLTFLSSYYYLLSVSLLQKSMILLFVGVAMLGLRFFLRRVAS